MSSAISNNNHHHVAHINTMPSSTGNIDIPTDHTFATPIKYTTTVPIEKVAALPEVVTSGYVRSAIALANVFALVSLACNTAAVHRRFQAMGGRDPARFLSASNTRLLSIARSATLPLSGSYMSAQFTSSDVSSLSTPLSTARTRSLSLPFISFLFFLNSDGGYSSFDGTACVIGSDGTVTVESAKWAARLLGAADSKAAELSAMFAGATAAPMEHVFGADYDTKPAATVSEAELLRACRTADARMIVTADSWVPSGEPKMSMASGLCPVL